MDTDTLSDKQRRFCEEYLIDLNATQAYIRAGYKVSAEVAAVNAHKLLRSPEVQSLIQTFKKQRSDRVGITADRVLGELAAVAFSRISDVMLFDENSISIKDSDQLSDSVVAAIAEVTLTGSGKVKRTSVRMYDKLQALKLLGKHLGLFNEFENSVKTLAKYGLILTQNNDGNWTVENRSM